VLAVKRRSWFVTTSVSSTPFKAALAKPRGERKSSESLDHAVRQLVAKAIVPEGEIIDVFSAAGLKQPDISILSDQFLAEVRGLKFKNVAAELLAKLLGDEIKVRSERNLVQSHKFSAVTDAQQRPGLQIRPFSHAKFSAGLLTPRQAGKTSLPLVFNLAYWELR
jgi:type I site-specific restriction-modification system R (restriction) subunit